MPIVPVSLLNEFSAVQLLTDPGHIRGPVAIPACIRFRIHWTLTNGKTAMNVLAMRVPAGFTPTATIAEGARVQLVTGATWTALATGLAPTAHLAAVGLQDVRPAADGSPQELPEILSTGAPTPGTSTQPALPDENAIVVTLRTGRAGRSFRGRMYIPGWADNAVDVGAVIASGFVNAATNWATTNITAAMTGAGGTWCLALPHRAAYTSIKGTVHPERLATTQDVTASLVRDNHWDTIRRRGLK